MIAPSAMYHLEIKPPSGGMPTSEIAQMVNSVMVMGMRLPRPCISSTLVMPVLKMMAPAHRNRASLVSAWKTICSIAPSKAVTSSKNRPHST